MAAPLLCRFSTGHHATPKIYTVLLILAYRLCETGASFWNFACFTNATSCLRLFLTTGIALSTRTLEYLRTIIVQTSITHTPILCNTRHVLFCTLEAMKRIDCAIGPAAPYHYICSVLSYIVEVKLRRTPF